MKRHTYGNILQELVGAPWLGNFQAVHFLPASCHFNFYDGIIQNSGSKAQGERSSRCESLCQKIGQLLDSRHV